MHELHPYKVSPSSLPTLQPPPISHLQPSQHESASAAGLPPTDPRQPSIIAIVLLHHPSTAAPNTSFYLQHSLPSRHASPLHATSQPGSSSDHPAHTCPAGASAHPSTLCLPDRLPASSSTGTSAGTSPSTCPPTTSPWPVELWQQTGERLQQDLKRQSPTSNQHMTTLDCTCKRGHVSASCHAQRAVAFLPCEVEQ